MAISAPTTTAAGGQTAANATVKAFFMLDPSFVASFPFPKPPAPTFVCRMNPKDLKIGGGGEWKEVPANQQHKLGAATFQKRKPRSIDLNFVVDHFELPSGNVAAELEPLFDWTEPRMSPDRRQASAAHIRLQWGAKRWFKCYIETLTVTYTLFSRSGAPLRANVDLKLKEALDPTPGTNPTSGGDGGERNHVVLAGDTLHSLANHYYGHPKLWRGLAAVNAIDDPQRLATGRVLSLPEIEVVEALV